MRLVKIKLAGFKSFVEPTVIPVTHDLVGVVGPNGCGKSNIIDAVRWVLGESKSSALRGESLQDVIFNGTANRKPVSRASVELILDNSQGKAAGAWNNYTELAVKRIIQRDGNSNYYINNIHVRRRDVTDLFLGTGIGNKGYAIIEQGMISRIIEAKPQELKSFLEEAAGISTYRERRRETEMRLTDTRNNLVRVEDISAELKKQIEQLEKQAEAAIAYNQLLQQMQATQQLLWLQHRNETTHHRLATEKEINTLERALETETTTLQSHKKVCEDARVNEQSLSEKLHTLQGQLYAAHAEKARIEQEITQINHDRERLANQLQDIEKQLTHNLQQRDTANKNRQHWLVELKNAQASHESNTVNNQQENEKLLALETACNQCQLAFDSIQQQLILSEKSADLAKTHIQHADKTIQQLESRRVRLQHESDALAAPDTRVLNNIELKAEQLKTQLTDTEKKLSETESEYAHVSQYEKSIVSQINTLQKELTQLQAQHKALQNLQNKIENNDALKRWLHKYEIEALPRLWQYLHIENDWESALESVLQERLNSLCVEKLDFVSHWGNDLPPGKLTILEFSEPIDSVNQHASTHNHFNWETLANQLTCDHATIASVLNHWLKNTFITRDLHDAVQQRQRLLPDEQFVTCEGHIVTHNAIHFYSPASQLHGVLSRQRELNLIANETNTLEQALETHQCTHNETTATLRTLTQAIQSYRNDCQQFTTQQHQYQLEKIKLSQAQTQFDQQTHRILVELEEIAQELVNENQQKSHAEKQLADHLEQTEAIRKQVESAEKELSHAKQQLADQQLKVQKSNQEIQEAVFNEKICQNKVYDIENTIKTLETSHTDLMVKRDHTTLEENKLDDAALTSQLKDSITESVQLEQNVKENRNLLDSTRHQIQNMESVAMVSEQKQTTMRETLSQLRLKKQEYGFLENKYTEQLEETQADEASLAALINQKSITALQNKINQINAKITAMGSVNLAAIEALESTRERSEALDAQTNDLKEAITILENTIEQIDQETRKRLHKTFHAVNHNLNQIFPVVFSGGKAELVFCDNKILESGITLTAQPPGKKNNSIHLLSGGEKALTALTLIFALFQLKPAPFCLLDEVDAPLDDSNTERFCELVKKLSQQTQFLFISHNKITMEIAQQLIGITMPNQGISKMVAVDIANTLNPNEKREIVLS